MNRSGRALALAALSLGLWITTGCGRQPVAGGAHPPRLVVVVVVDQMRADYPLRFREQLKGGFDTLLRDGTQFTEFFQDHSATDTAVGHSTLLSGRYPAHTGIVRNEWPDRGSGREVQSIEDGSAPQLDGGHGVSPRRLLGSSLADWLLARYPSAKVVSVAGKDRVAVLMAGHRPRDVYWYSVHSGSFTTSTYYRTRLPAWVAEFNRGRSSRAFAGAYWRRLAAAGSCPGLRADDSPLEKPRYGLGRAFPHPLPAFGETLHRALLYTPFVDQITAELAERALIELDLGADTTPDLLLVGLSATDYVGHSWGPNSQEMCDQIQRVDRLLGDLFSALQRRVALRDLVVVVTSDHGVPPIPGSAEAEAIHGRWVNLEPALTAFDGELTGELGTVRWLLGTTKDAAYLDHQALRAAGVEPAAIARRLADRLSAVDGVARVLTREDLEAAGTGDDEILRRVIRAYNPQRAGDVVWVLAPGCMRWKPEYAAGDTAIATTHGSPYDYDCHVPLFFYGSRIAAGRSERHVSAVDLAPTLARILGVEPQGRVDGTPLTEVLPPADNAS